MLLRIRSPDGQARLTLKPTTDLHTFWLQIMQAMKLDSTRTFDLALDPKGEQRVQAQPTHTIEQLGLKHGDLLFIIYHNDGSKNSTSNVSTHGQTQSSKASSALLIKQDPVDEYLQKQPGTIKRERDTRFCKHGSSGMCEYCLPLQPYDAKYLEENKIKHMAFHAYLRQLMEQAKTTPITSSHFVPPLDNLDFKVANPCPSKSHGQYPIGICTKCQPSAITLQSQNFRMVDHIEFESPAIIDNFLQFWRSSGAQRVGILYGKYEPYAEVPLGVKAVVSAIYEPLQEDSHDTIQLAVTSSHSILNNATSATVDAVATSLGLVRVGIIYTDLTDDGSGNGTVVCKRHADSYFLSSAEIVFAGVNQEQHPMVTPYSALHTFGSRFVTCVISGNSEGGIDIFSYQVSNMCAAMVRDNIIEASVEPSLMRVAESTDKQYVPEVFYKFKNEYNIMVKNAAKPTFPVEYLLVTVTHGFPSTPSPTFTNTKAFPIENRVEMGSAQDMHALKQHLTFTENHLLDLLSDFHVLLFIKESSILDQTDFDLLVDGVRTRSEPLISELSSRSSWQTLLMILQETATHAPTASKSNTSAVPAAPKSCQYCTFVNQAGVDSCEMCGLPLD
ncbi:nuclear protein localization protein 4 [Batrachochytrium dendrobatidis]|nr:nuclear protein localization protein 4 [Batrachochytrium dendrobatidis]